MPILMVLIFLTACDTSEIFPGLQPPPMIDPVGQSQNSPSQLDPTLTNRVNAERSEPLPTPPPMPDRDRYGNLGTVPPKPVLPTPAEIAGDTKELEVEQQAGAARIAAQAGEPLPDTLPKPNSKGPPPANPAYIDGNPTSDAAAQAAPASTLRLSGDNSAFLPQSETVESTDLIPPGAR
jgi:hypothetical protein